MDLNNLTTYISGLLLTICSYFAISQTSTNFIIQVLAPILAIIIGYLITYLTEKYPSSIVTPVTIEKDTVEENTEDGI
jgi:uncharacterized membrane protein YadS